MTGNGQQKVVSDEYVRGGKSTTYEFTEQQVGNFIKWHHRKKGEQKWNVCTSYWEKRALKAWHKNSELKLFADYPKLREMEAEIQELKAMVNPPVSSGEMPFGDDITTETIIKPVMYREDILGPRPKYRTIQRHHVGDARYYVIQFEDGVGGMSRPQLYAGVTSVCKAVSPRSKFLDEWLCGFATYEDAMKSLNLSSAKGTVMHTLFAMCMDKKLPDKFDGSDFDRILRGIISRELEGLGVQLAEVFGEWRQFMCKALLGFKQFMYDHNVEPLAVEVVLGEPHVYFDDASKPLYGYFAQLDLICHLDIEVDGLDRENPYKTGPRKGQPRECKVSKRVLAIVDFKSGDGDYPEHDMQLELQVPLLRKAFPQLDTKEVYIFNWHPSDFKVSSLSNKVGDGEEAYFGFKLINKTGRNPRDWANDHLWIWRKYHARELPVKMVFQGDPNIDTPPSENVRFVDYATYWEEKVARAISHKFADL